MPDPQKYENEDEFMSDCISEVEGEGEDHDQAVAQCTSMWKERDLDEESEKKSMQKENEKEIRVLPVSDFRFQDDEGKPKFEGYAAVFNRWSEDLGGFKEKIAPRAFKKALKGSDVRALFNHDRNYVLGRSTSGTLNLKEDNKGLFISNDPPETQWAKDLMVSVNRGDITQMSFGFTVSEDEWKEDKEGRVTRTIHGIDRLYDVSVVTEPAYPDTTVALRSLEKVKGELKEDKPNFQVIDEPKEDKEEESNGIHIHINAIDAESFSRWIEENKDEAIQSIIDAINKRKDSNTSEVEPMQDGEENKDGGEEERTKGGENSEPMQGEEEVRDYWKNN